MSEMGGGGLQTKIDLVYFIIGKMTRKKRHGDQIHLAIYGSSPKAANNFMTGRRPEMPKPREDEQANRNHLTY